MPRDEAPLRAAIYARVSTPKQKSVPQQVALCRNRCDELGFRVRYIVKEEGVSAKTTDRPRLQHLLQLCREGRVDIILVWKLDRLVRSLTDLLNTYRYLESINVDLHSVTEQFDTRTPFGRFSFRNIASAAELERELIAERARMGKLAQALKGRWPTQRPPLGYVLDEDRHLVVDPLHARVVRRIYSWYVAGVPLTEISRRLGCEDAVTPLGRPFSPGAVQYLVRNPVYVGRLSVLGVEHDLPELRIVNEAVWKTAQERRGKRCTDRNTGSRRQAAIDAVFDDYLAYLEEASEFEAEVAEAVAEVQDGTRPDEVFIRHADNIHERPS